MNALIDVGFARLPVVFIAVMAVCGFVVSAQTVPVENSSFELGADGWFLSGGEGGITGDAPHGERAVYLSGEADSQASTKWQTAPMTFQGDAVYRLSAQARRVEGSGGSPIFGTTFCNRDLHEVTPEWDTYSFYFAAPPGDARSPIHLGQWNVGGVVAFDDVSLVKAAPVYRRHNAITLGDGEYIEGDRYVFTAPFTGESANHARPLRGYDCYFNKPRWVFSDGTWVVYRHEVSGQSQKSAEIEVTVGYYTGGAVIVEASVDDASWVEAGTLAGMEAVVLSLPDTLFPANAVSVRFRAASLPEKPDEPVGLQIYGYSYRAGLERAPGDFHGATRFVAVTESDEQVRLLFDALGETIPGGANELRFRAFNLTENSIDIEPRLHVSADGGPGYTASVSPLNLPAQAEHATVVAMPYDIPGAGDVVMSLELGDSIAYRAETAFTVSRLFEADYGFALPDTSDAVALWWASSGWKVSRERPAPREASAAMNIRLAQNEREAAQFVLRPSKPLRNLRVTPQLLQGEGGVLPAEAVEVLRVAYVPVSQPTDYMGAVAPWPDPLPPLEGALDLAADTNQPFWVCVRAEHTTPPGVYQGAIALDADGWSAVAPLTVEVFGFALPDRKTCVSAFGFNAPLAFRYHNARTDAERRAVYENYLTLLSEHHISIYNPAFLDPMEYSWPRLPKWHGGERDETESRDGNGSLLLRDASATANSALAYDEMLTVPRDGIRIAFDYKTGAPGHVFMVTLMHYDVSGVWLRGQNRDVAVEGDGTWQRYDAVVDAFPEAARQFALRLWATEYTEEGKHTGAVWIDNIEVRDLTSGTALIQDAFAPFDKGNLEYLFAPEFDWTAWDAAMTRAFEHYHFNAFALSVPGMGGGTFHARHEPSLLGYEEGAPEYSAAFTAWCGGAVAHLREKGWLDAAYVYWFDEPSPKDYEFVMNGFRKLKDAAPGLNRMLTETIVPELVGGPTIWCPVSYNYDHTMAEQRRSEDEKIWWYICTGPKAPYATLFIDHPATELRVWLWQTWKRGIDGVLIWQTNYWHSDEAYPDAPQNPYEDPMGWVTGYSTPVGAKRPWGNGDGRFIYPPLAAADGRPADAVLTPPVSSIRFEMLRDGIEDYEYCVILRDLLEKHKDDITESDYAIYRHLLEVPENITKSLTEFTFDPAPIDAHREAVARAVVKLANI